ncbi:MAG: UTRA domain-containing protein [Polymorphobacter sp.]
MSRAPLHVRIGAAIESAIMSGAWKPGHRIPAEHVLMAEYGCARMTVSKALSRLAASGLIERRRRAGSFVAAPPEHHAALAIPDIRAEIMARGESYRLELLARRIRAPTAADRARMAMTAGTVLELRCRHFANDRAYAIEDRLINLGAVPAAATVDFTVEPPGSWLLGHVPWTEAEHAIAAVNADATTAMLLGIARGAACLRLERWTWYDRGAPTPGRRLPERITHVRQTFPGTSYRLSARFAPRPGAAGLAGSVGLS